MAGPVGALQVRLGANTAQYETGMRRASTVARRTGQDIDRAMSGMSIRTSQAFAGMRVAATGLGIALGAGFLIQQIRSTLQWASSLSETAQQIGVTVEQLQILRFAADQNGASVEGMERAIAILNRTLGQAQAGLPAAIQSFRAIGITKEQLDSFRNAGEAFPRVAEAISRFGSSAQQAAAAQRLFGRGASELLPILAQGRAGWDAATQAAIRNGVITQEQADKADRAADALSELGAALRVQLLGAIVDALPGLIEFARILGTILSAVIQIVGWLGRMAAAIIRPFTTNMSGYLTDAVNSVRGPQIGRGILGVGGRAASAPRGPQLNLASTRSGGGSNNDAEQAARRRHQYEQELRDAEIANLRAMEENTSNIDEINEIQGSIVVIENQKWEAEQAFRRSQNELNDTQLAELYERKRILIATEAEVRARQYNLRVQEQENERAEQQQGYARDRLQAEADMARTMEERRRIELDILRITTEQRRDALALRIQRARDNRDEHAASVAQLELDNLPNQTAASERRIRRDTMGPLEAYMTELPRTAEQVRESLQSIAVDGLQSITDGLVDVVTGARKMGDVFKSVVTGIIADLLRIQLQKAIIGPLANMLGGLLGGGGGAFGGVGGGAFAGIGAGGAGSLFPGRASGGPVLPGRTYLIGEKGPELLHMGGAGTVIANDNMGGGGDIIVNQRFTFEGVAVTQQEFVQGLNATKNATMQAVGEARRRAR